MVNEDCVKELFKMAVYDAHEEAFYRQMGEYYKRDYVGKEIVKSIFFGTFAFALILVLVFASDVEGFMTELNQLNLTSIIVKFVFFYIAFMAVYLLITVAVYKSRFRIGRQKLRDYYGHLRRINKMYDREEKLKS